MLQQSVLARMVVMAVLLVALMVPLALVCLLPLLLGRS